jgi:hypothetical protein
LLEDGRPPKHESYDRIPISSLPAHAFPLRLPLERVDRGQRCLDIACFHSP